MPAQADLEADLGFAATFLQNQYNSTIGLLREAPEITEPTIYWLWTDNNLGYHALEYYNESMADEIKSTLDFYGYDKMYAYETLFRQTVNLPFKDANTYYITEETDYIIKLDIYNGSTMEDWESYGNLLCLAALSEWWQRHFAQAKSYFSQVKAMWDGKGIADKAFQEGDSAGVYQTYKLAKLLYTERILGQVLTFHDTAESIIWQMQNDTTGGIITGYDSEFSTNGHFANVETTSLVIGSYKWEYEPYPKPKPVTSPTREASSELISSMVTFAVIMYVGTYLIKNGRKKRY